jgi:hypothetical protein
LKKSKLELNDAEIEEKLSYMILLFKFVDDKDIFQKHYTRSLAKRLVFSSSVSDELEQFMISRLKETCGAEYTNKLQRMMTDIQVSSTMNQQFADFNGSELYSALGLDFQILVLTSGSWPFPSTSSAAFNLPTVVRLQKITTS